LPLPPSPASPGSLVRPDFRKNMQFVTAFPVWLVSAANSRLFPVVFAILLYIRKNRPYFNFLLSDVYLYHYNIKSLVRPFKRSYWETIFFLVFIVWLFSPVFACVLFLFFGLWS
jgi:hypothetical protein